MGQVIYPRRRPFLDPWVKLLTTMQLVPVPLLPTWPKKWVYQAVQFLWGYDMRGGWGGIFLKVKLWYLNFMWTLKLFFNFFFFLAQPLRDFGNAELFTRTYFTHKTTYEYLSLFTDCWNIQENLDSDLFWAGDGRFWGGFPPFWILAPRIPDLPLFLLHLRAAFFEAHLLSPLKTLGYEHWKGVYKKSDKTSKSPFLETAISRVKWQYWRNFSSMFRKKIDTFSQAIDEIRSLLRVASSTSYAVSDFEVCIFFGHIVVFCQCGFEKLVVLENWSRSKNG